MHQPIHIDAFSNVDNKSRRLLVIAWLFVAIVAFLLAFTNYSVGILSAGRAYVGGEGLWSKSQKEMIYALARYARYHEPKYYQTYLQSLAVNRGDHQARIELEKKDPDFRIAAAGFLLGRNHPDDIDGMISLYRNFRHVAEIDKAIDIWTRADIDIEKIMAIAEIIRAKVQSGTLDDAATVGYLQQLSEINEHLTPMEDEFSYTLGQAARRTQTVMMIVMLVVVTVLLTGAYIFSQKLVRQNDRVHKAVREAGMQFRALLQNAPLSIVVNGLDDDTVLYANDHALSLFKVSANAIGRLRVSSFYIKPEDREALKRALRGDGSLRDWEVLLRDATGSQFWALISCQMISYSGRDCIFSALTNIDARKRNQEEMRHRAFHDELTGLPNRAMFMDFTRKLIDNADPRSDAFAILFIDLDRFKVINDELGHEVGDRLLQEFARRLRDTVAPEDVVSRLGGDEFVVLIDMKSGNDTVQRTADRLIEAMVPSFNIDGIEINISTSIGISHFPQDGTDLKTLVKLADVAMYQAKDDGRNRAQFYSDSLHHHSDERPN